MPSTDPRTVHQLRRKTRYAVRAANALMYALSSAQDAAGEAGDVATQHALRTLCQALVGIVPAVHQIHLATEIIHHQHPPAE